MYNNSSCYSLLGCLALIALLEIRSAPRQVRVKTADGTLISELGAGKHGGDLNLKPLHMLISASFSSAYLICTKRGFFYSHGK